MIDVLFKWIIVGGANRIVVTAPELVDQGGVTPNGNINVPVPFVFP